MDLAKLAGIALTRYKAFRTEQNLDVRPITLLFGHNSVGKSAALRLCQVLSDAARYDPTGKYPGAILNYSSEALRGATLKEIVHGGTPGGGLVFSLRWEDGLNFGLEIKQDVRGVGEVVSSFIISNNDYKYEFSATDPSKNTFELTLDGATHSKYVSFAGIRPIEYSKSWPNKVKLAISDVCHRLSQFGRDVHWISAVRSQPPRAFMLQPGVEISIRPDGLGTAEVLRASSISSDGVADQVSEWLNKICGCRLSFSSLDGEVLHGRQWYPFNVNPEGSGVDLAVRDVGEGISQALPVITLCKLASNGNLGAQPVLAIEQPELHLHPKAITELANGIVDCLVLGTPATHIIETHSESFLLAIQIALLEGRIAPADVVVHWVSASSEGASLTKIEFDDRGYPSTGWPSGVFRESLEQARRVSELRFNT